MRSTQTNGIAAYDARPAKTIWPALRRAALQKLRALSEENALSSTAGDITHFKGWYVTHAGCCDWRAESLAPDARPLRLDCI